MSFTDDYYKALERKKKEKERNKNQDIAPVLAPTRNDIMLSPTVVNTNPIAPEKEWYDKVFKKSEVFNDGYQFGDVTKTILGTGADFSLNVLGYTVDRAEGIGDAINYKIADISETMGNKDFADILRGEAEDSLSQKLLGETTKKVDKWSIFDENVDKVANSLGVIPLMGSLGALGLSPAAANILSNAFTGISAFGSGMSEAYQGDATDEEAKVYGAITSGAEVLSDLIFGGMGKAINLVGYNKGLINLDDMVAKKISNLVTNQYAKNVLEYVVKMGGEGLEEVISGAAQMVGKKFTYMSEKEWKEVFQTENLLEDFIVSAITSGFSQSVDLYNSNKTKTDFITGLTENEQKVVDKEVENRIAQEEANGKKITNKDKSKIYDDVIAGLDKGYISIDSIESVLGGDTYKKYKDTIDKEDELIKGFEELGKTERSQLKSQLHKEVFDLVKDSRLVESYNEQKRMTQSFEADFSKIKGAKYEDAARKTLENAIKAGANNSNRLRDIIEMNAKFSGDTGVVFEYGGDEQIKNAFIERQTKAIAEIEDIPEAERTEEQNELLSDMKETLAKVESGEVIVDGDITSDGIMINLDSPKALNRLTGHEITHSLEENESYNDLVKAIKKFAGKEFESRIAERTEIYKGVSGYGTKEFNAMVEKEVVADLVGDYIFTDTDFINKLSTEQPNLFKKIYNEIKYLCKIATAGSKEARELEKVKRAFEQVYKESGTAKSDTKGEIKHSISEIVDQNNKSYGVGVKLDSTLLDNLSPKERVEMVKEYVNELGGEVFAAYDNNGNAVNITIADSKARFKTHKGKSKPVNKDLSSKYIKNEVKQEAIALVNELVTTSKYDNSNTPLYAHDWLDDNGKNDWEYWTTYIQDKNNTIWEATLNIANTSNGEKILYDIYPIKKAGQSVKSDTSSADSILTQNPKKSSEKIDYSLSDSNLKKEQYQIIQEHNPAPDSNYVWVRSPDDIKTFAEAINDEESFVWGDYSKEDAIRDLKRNKVVVYSSHPIEQGAFVSTSFNQARDYAGDGSKVYSKEVPTDAVAWINGDEGQYAEVLESKRSLPTDIEGNPIESERISSDELDTKYSLSKNSEIAEGQSNYIAKHNTSISVEELAEAQRITAAMVDVMMKHSNILPEDKIGKVLTKNGSYDRSVENTTICVRTLAYNEFVDKVQEEIGRPLTQMESFLVSQKLYDIATEPQCLYCYVSLDRKAFNDMLLRYMQERDAVIDKYKSGKWDDLKTYTEEQVNKMTTEQKAKSLYCNFLNGRKSTKNTIKRFNDWLNYVDNGTQLLSLADISTEARQKDIADGKNSVLAAQLKDARAYAQSASWSKIQKDYVAYKDEILKLGDRVIKNLNEHYGMRWYSFSDYSAAFIVENMQQITDAAIRGLKGLSYTKDTDYAEIFAPSGMNINISVFVNTDENGNFFIDEKQSANFEKALELRKKYPNVGIVATVTNDEALRWAGEQEWSDVIIPFHIVRTGTDVAEYYKWLNYTSESGDTIGDKDLWDAYLDSLNLKSENARKKVSKNIYPNEHKNDKATYLALCESRGLSPRFVRFAGEDWYMKLVNETRLSADESSTLKPKYDLEAAQRSFAKFIDKGGYEGGWYKEGVDVDAEAKTVADDVLAGKKANEVDYGRQDGFVPENLIAGRKKNRSHKKASLSKQGEQSKIQSYSDVYGKDFGVQKDDIAPIREDITKKTYPDDIAPMKDNVINLREYGSGDFYVAIGEEAKRIADALELKLTKTEINGVTTYMVGFPVRYLKTYQKKAINNGFTLKVGTAETKDVYSKDITPIKNDIAPMQEDIAKSGTDIAPVRDDIAPVKESKKSKATEEQTARILTKEPEVKKKSQLWSKFKTNFIDKASPFETLALKTGNREVDAKYNSIRYSDTKAQTLIGEGDEGVKALNDIQTEVEKNGLTEALYEYLYHKHNVDRMSLESREAPNLGILAEELHNLELDTLGENQLYAISKEPITKKTDEKRAHLIKTVRAYLKSKSVKNKPVFGSSVTAELSQKIVDKYEADNPKLMEYANDIYDYNRYLRNLLVEGGVISQETADLWEEIYPHYVPIRRIDSTGININVPLDSGRTGVNAPIKRAKGGNTDILPLFDTMAQRTLQTYKAIAKNRFGVELKNTLGTSVSKTETSLDEVIDSIDAQEDMLQKGAKGKNPTFTVFENGKKVTFEITDEMYDAMKPTSEGLTYTNKFLNRSMGGFRGLVTEFNPTFAITNPIKDSQDVLINSQHPAKTYRNFPKAIKELKSKGKWYTEYMKNGGADNTYFDKQTNTFIKEKSGLSKAIGFPLEKISMVNNFIERIPRLAEYIASREMGRSIDVSMLDAARVTTNFSAGGDVTKFLNRNGFTFLNASVQGAAQQVRNVREAKEKGLKGWVHLATKVAIAGLPGMLLNGLLWDDDEEYEELSDYVKQNYYIIGKTKDGRFVRIPKGRALAVIQEAFTQVQNALTGDDEADLESFLDLAISNLAPNNPLDNNIIAPIIQVKDNKTWYGEDLVPTRLQDVPDAEQYDESTDVISKWLGETLDISPYKINYLLNQYSGGLGDIVLPMLTPEAESGDNSLLGFLGAPLRDKFSTDIVFNNQNATDFYNVSDELTVNANSNSATSEDILKSKYFNSIGKEVSELYKAKREIQNSDLSDDVKYNQVRDIQKQINEITKNALDTYEDITIEGKYANIGDKHYRMTDEGEWQKITDEQLEKQDEVIDILGITPSEYWGNKAEYDMKAFYPEKYAVLQEEGISAEEYNNYYKEGFYKYNDDYSWASENSGKYTISKVVTSDIAEYRQYTSDLSNIEADKNSNGKPISGSAKAKKWEYINGLDVDEGSKYILFKSLYKADDTYNDDIVIYLSSRDDISTDEKITILEELGATVDDEGYVKW